MKILLLADGMEAGGAETHILTLARSLLAAGHTVGLCSAGGAIADRMELEGVLCRKIPKIGRNPLAFLRAKQIIRAELAKNGYEILHAHTRMTALLAHQICNPYMQKLAKKPVFVVTAHAKFRADGLFRLLSVWGERTIAVSEDLRADLADRYRLPAERITVIPNGIDGSAFCPAPKEEGKPLAKGDFLEKEVQILFVSRLEPDCSRGADLLLEAAGLLLEQGRFLPPFSVTIAGGGSEFSRLCGLAGRVNLAAGREVCRVVKPHGEEDLIRLYRRADLFVGVSRAAMEAAFCGCAVLLCGNEGYGGVLSPDRMDLAAGNFCCRGLPAATLSRLVRDLTDQLKNPYHRRANAQKTNDWVRKTFSATAAARETEMIYKALLDRKGSAAPAGFFRCKALPRVCIGGYAGCGNLGDDAILSGVLQGLFQNGIPPEAITVLSGSPRRDSKRFGVRCVGRKNPLSAAVALLRSHLFVSGGGTLLQDRTGGASPFYYLALLRLARLCGCKTLLLGGLGPLSGGFARRAAKKELGHCALLLLRDSASLGFAQGMGLKKQALHVGADPAFLLPEPPPLRAAFLVGRLVGEQNRRLVCVCPCGGVSTAGLAAMLKSTFSGFFPMFLLCDPARDASAAKALQKTFGGALYAPREASEALALFGASAAVLSCRLHPLILSVRMRRRCVCFSGGDPKLAAFCQRAGILLFPAEMGRVILPCAASFFSLPPPNPTDFCRMAAKDLAILSRMVYNRGRGFSAPKARGKGRMLHEKRTAGGFAPPDHH